MWFGVFLCVCERGLGVFAWACVCVSVVFGLRFWFKVGAKFRLKSAKNAL